MAESPITARSQDFATWYQDVVLQGDMAEPAEIVKGCMVIKANGYAVWELLQRELDDRFKATGHQNMYFPLLIPQSFLHKEVVVLMARGFEAVVELALQQLPHSVAVGLDDHAAFDDFRRLGHVTLQNDVLVPGCKILSARSNRRFCHECSFVWINELPLHYDR